MTSELEQDLEAARTAIIAGRVEEAIAHCDSALSRTGELNPEAADKERITSTLIELHALADASLAGTKKAVAQIEDILRAASNLQVYNPDGQRQETSIVANMPQRY